MECGDWREILSAGLDVEVSAERMTAAGTHTGTCSACADWLSAATVLRRAIRDSPEPAPESAERLLRVLRGTVPDIDTDSTAVGVRGVNGGSDDASGLD